MRNNGELEFAVVGLACRLPGARNLAEFEDLLFTGRSAITELPEERLDRTLYLDPVRGRRGKTYTTLGGWVPDRPLDPSVADAGALSAYDSAHLLFCETALRAWTHAGLTAGHELASRCGVYVGHSGGTQSGGPLSLATQIDEALDFLNEIEAFRRLPPNTRSAVMREVAASIRAGRPRRTSASMCRYQAYYAASLTAARLGMAGPRQVVDAACASSLLALNQSLLALEEGRIDAAIVGGATYNNVDNLILFSHSQACSESGSRPFDDAGSGLVSSEGYVAIVVTSMAEAHRRDLPIRALIRGVGVSSDGRGKSLWAPRREGQELAIRRAYGDHPSLSIDYLEAHATSTQLGDATELESLTNLRRESGLPLERPLLIGSVKSNIGHTLEAAGLVGLVKLILSLNRGQIPLSINYRTPTTRFDWSQGLVEVVDRNRPWTGSCGPRRGAVNAFGIGGLNAHVCVEEAASTTAPGPPAAVPPWKWPYPSEPVAIVGRGVVLPGAANVPALFQLLDGEASAIGEPPRDRWRSGFGLHQVLNCAAADAPVCRGGFISDYHFDAERYRIPPKQVRQANPLQLMLLDAVTQAIQECDQGRWEFDRTRTSVVIGTLFNGDFSNHLQVGMRLPEIERELERSLKQAGVSSHEASDIARRFAAVYLESRPALLDETGSFTASTLASRIAKTFDLMGGACAIDSDDASGISALGHALDLLRSGHSDAVICGAGHRALDLVAFEHLHFTGRLLASGNPADIPDDLAKFLPGEGVAILLLRRLRDAQREQRPIFGIIDEVSCSLRTSADSPPRTRLRPDDGSRDAAVARKIGYIMGAQGVIRILTETATTPAAALSAPPLSGWRAIAAESTAEDGFGHRAVVRVPTTKPQPVQSVTAGQHGISMSTASHARPCEWPTRRLIRMKGVTEGELQSQLEDAIANPALLFQHEPARFDAADRVRLAVTAATPDELAKNLTTVRSRWERGQRCAVLESAQAVIWTVSPDRSRIAWLFPGQGSQYSGPPAVLAHAHRAQELLAQLDASATQAGLPVLSTVLTADDNRLGTDIWWTQAWVLAASALLADTLLGRGHRPDVMLGHSFGEFSAALAARSLTPQQAVRISRRRAEAVVMCCREPGVLVSVRGMPSEVHAALRRGGQTAIVTHHNSPRQTVVACEAAELKTIQSALTNAGLASIRIAVPAAFHTPGMAEAEAVFERTVAEESIRAPTCAFLSATTVSYLAEPAELRRSLVTQLTHPVLYEPSARRLLADGCGLLLEIGPNDVLTRLNREIAGDQALAISLDLPGQSFADRLLLVEGALDCVMGDVRQVGGSIRRSTRPAQDSADRRAHQPSSDDVEIIDVRAKSRRADVSPAGPVENVDALPSAPVRNQAVSSQAWPPRPGAAVQPVAADGAVHEFLIALTVDLTGYSRDVVELDADLEADLGLDSIKKAQMVGELSEWAGLSIRPDQLRLGSITTLRKLAALAARDLPQPEIRKEAPAPVRATASPGHSCEGELIEQLLIDFVLDQTGYSREIIDLDADLEADLGVDSIKRAQLLGEMHEQFNLGSLSAGRIGLNRFPTLRSIKQFLLDELEQRDNGALRPAVESAAVPGAAALPARSDEPVLPAARAPARAPASVENPIGAISDEILGSDPCDVVPALWQELFRVSTTMDEGVAVRQRGQARGARYRREIRAALRLMVASSVDEATFPAAAFDSQAEAELQGLAIAAGVSLGAVLSAAARTRNESWPTGPTRPPDVAHPKTVGPTASDALPRRGFGDEFPAPEAVDSKDVRVSGEEVRPESDRATRRFALRMAAAPRRPGTPVQFKLNGPALIVGDNPLADAIEARVAEQGQQAFRLRTAASAQDAAQQLEHIWRTAGSIPHVFLTTPHDRDSLRSIDARAWASRRVMGVQVPFQVCQMWMERMIATNRMDSASIAGVINLGGDFGFSGRQVVSPEGGGIGGLLKAMVIEAWMRGHRTTPMKVVDVPPGATESEAVEGLWRELAVPSYDMEVSAYGSERVTVQAVAAPLDCAARSRVQPRGVWVVSGGGRGITAMAAMALAERYALRLHLVGTAPAPAVGPGMRLAARTDRSRLRRELMRQASDRGENAIEVWRDAEKAIEIDSTLEACRERGISAVYHSCDVADLSAVAALLESIRREDGPIRGVIHGAGAGQDARFDRKRPDKVEKCIRAKVDGCLSLMAATSADPLDWFVTFGSISGRFGANGHTDYSLANDMLAKIVDRYRAERREVSSLTFHWHAWGDVGMATKPEARLALEMIDMEFMPAAEGVNHFLAEFERGGDEPEVLITDHKYYRKFFPAERIHDSASPADDRGLPLLGPPPGSPGPVTLTTRLDPVTDLFLAQHRVNERPTLPFVVAIELMAECAQHVAGGGPVRSCRNVEALQPIKFAVDEPLHVDVTGAMLSEPAGGDQRAVRCVLKADFRRRDGRLVEPGREHFRGEFLIGERPFADREPWPDLSTLDWRPIEYLGPDAPVYHGPELRSLRRLAVAGDVGFGQIGASAPVQLFGGDRPSRGWTVACDAMDACLYACAVFGARLHGKSSLPVRFEEIRFGRLPDPGEPCLIRIERRSEDERGLDLSFRLWGQNGDVLLDVPEYRIAWMRH